MGIGPWALMGAAALLGGIQRTAISLCVIILEGTGQIRFLLPVILTVGMATFVGDMINQGVYHVMIHLKHMPCLESVCRGHHTVKASDVMSTPVVSIQITPSVAEVTELLTSTQHHGFPVLRMGSHGQQVFAGLVLRSQLEGLLHKEQFYEEETVMKSPRRGSVVDTLVSTRNEEHGDNSL